MKFYSNLLFFTLLIILLTGCQEDERLKMSPGSSKDGISEMILSFYNQIHPNSRSTNTLFSIKYISTETFKISDENKTRNASQNETYSIHTVLLDFEGTPGYAILSDTPGIEKIFYYTEEGCVGDTAAIAPLKEMIESFPIIAEDIMTGNYIDSQADNQNYPNIQPIVPFSWHQKKPFNNYAAYCACTYCSTDVMGNHRPMGCVTIALGQAIATVKKFTGTFYGNRDIDFDNLPQNGFSGTGAQYLQVSHFLQEIALNCQTKFGCDKSTTRLEAAYNYLYDLGYNASLQNGAINEYKFIENLTKGFPHVCGGHNSSSGHAWILDGYTNNAYGRHYHINWGHGEKHSDGWSLGTFFGDLTNYTTGNKDHFEYQKSLQQLYLEY